MAENIESTYTYSFAKNHYGYEKSESSYNAIEYFEQLLEKLNPFLVVMELSGYAIVNAKKFLDKNNIKWTQKELEEAEIPLLVKAKMNTLKKDEIESDVIRNYDSYSTIQLKDMGIEIVNHYEGANDDITTIETLQKKEYLKKMQEELSDRELEVVAPSNLNKEQTEAFHVALSKNFSCIIGGAGTGKSYVTAEIVDNIKGAVVVLTPTHKAREAIDEKLKNGKRSQTIHSWVHNANDCDTIVVDESGMLSTELFVKVMREFYKHANNIIFIGDKNQLPPIEYGRPFEELQEILPTVELKENLRSEAVSIVNFGNDIMDGFIYDEETYKDVEFVDSVETAYEKGAEIVLTFRNADVTKANEYAQNFLNENGTSTISEKFKVGDKIVAKTNKRNRFFNGQMFELVGEGKAKNLKTGEELIFQNWQELEYNFDLAYALTIHKSQGSEWGVVAYKPSNIDSQNLAYVAATRAKNKLIIIGNMFDVMSACERRTKKWRAL